MKIIIRQFFLLLLFSFFFIPTDGQLANSPWPMNRGNPQHTGYSPYTINDNPGEIVWTFNCSVGIGESSPVIGNDGTIYFGNIYDDTLYAINPNSSLKWKYKTGDYITSTPAININGEIFFGSYDHYFYCLYSDGTLKWRLSLNSNITTSPAIGKNGIIYITSSMGILYAITDDGKIEWEFDSKEMWLSSPSLDHDGNIYFTDGLIIHSISQNGTLIWKREVPIGIFTEIVFTTNGSIIVGAGIGDILSLDPNGTANWQFKADDDIWDTPAVSDDAIYFGCDDSYVYAIDINGKLLWKFKTKNDETLDFDAKPAISSDGILIIGTQGGGPKTSFYAFYPNGSLKWEIILSHVHSTPAINSNGLIYVTAGNQLFCIGWSSDKSTVPPEPPMMPKAEPADDSVDLTWQPPVSGVSDAPRGYNVYRKAQDSDLTFIGTVNGTATTSFKDNTVEIEGDYTYVVTSINNMGESGPSVEITAHYKPPKEPEDKKGGWSQLPGFEAGALFIAMAIVVAVLRKRRE